jgi:hypothetical protein
MKVNPVTMSAATIAEHFFGEAFTSTGIREGFEDDLATDGLCSIEDLLDDLRIFHRLWECLRPAVHALSGASFGHHNLGEQGQGGFEPVPDPDGKVFAGGILEARDIVEVAVVELFPEGTESGGDVGVINQPAEFGVAGTGHDELDFEAVAVQAAAFVGGRQFGQQMGGFELEGFAE